jgi:hypothetical protein
VSLTYFSIIERGAVREKPALIVRFEHVNNCHSNQITWLERITRDAVHPSPNNAMSSRYAVTTAGNPHDGQTGWVDQV